MERKESMKIFVASWFFPPQTSSEGIVTYKLLRNSQFNYDVVCANCSLWGYRERIDVDAENIHVISVDTDDLNVWKEKTIAYFEERHKWERYDAVMTRCMPNEGLEVGLSIKEKHPDIKWICSLADPVANNPYWLHAIESASDFPDNIKRRVVRDLALEQPKWGQDWLNHANPVLREQFYWKSIQDQAMNRADMLITPSVEQQNYMDPDAKRRNKFLIVPHSFDEQMNVRARCERNWEKGRIHFVFTGYADEIRSLRPFVEAVKRIGEHFPELLEKMKFHFYGNYSRGIVDQAYAYQIEEAFEFAGNVSYMQSLAIMQEADWLLHVDAWFESLRETGGSIFFAGKLADYMGSGKPILALTGEKSPAGIVVEQYGGVVCLPWEIEKIAGTIMEVVLGRKRVDICEPFRMRFDAKRVAAIFDIKLEELLKHTEAACAVEVLKKRNSADKALTICVPCYNAQKTMRRTLDSLLQIERADKLDVIIVDDGSTDRTAEIGFEYVQRFPESVTLVRKPNGGHGSGINQGIERAEGRYFRVVDSDDWLDSKALNAEIEYILNAQVTPDAIYMPYDIVDQKTGKSEPWPSPKNVENGRVYTFDEVIDELGVENVYFTMAATSFRTDILKTMGLRVQEKRFYTDSEFILKPIVHVQTTVFLPNAAYKYLRGQTEQSVAPLSFVKNYADHEAIVQELIGYEQRTAMSDAQRTYMQYILKQHLITNYQILTEFDQDASHALGLMKSFDLWLSKEAPSYYDWTRENIAKVRQIRSADYDERKFRRLKAKASAPKRDGKATVKRMVKRAVYSPLFMNRFAEEFIRRQKENNGFAYRMYRRFK